MHWCITSDDLFSAKAIIHFSSSSAARSDKILQAVGISVIATGDRPYTGHTRIYIVTACVNWRRRSFRYKYLNETRVQIHAAHTKQMLRARLSLSSTALACGYPFTAVGRCTWVCYVWQCAMHSTYRVSPRKEDWTSPSCRYKLAKYGT